MAKLQIVTGVDNEILRKKSEKVKKIDKKLKKLIGDMLQTLEEKDGLGLAAPQVGLNIDLLLARLNSGDPEEMIVAFINPEIIFRSEEIEIMEEGCLSLPGEYDEIERAKEIRIKFEDLRGNEQILDLSGLNARILQHETDHLKGILFTDYLENKNSRNK